MWKGWPDHYGEFRKEGSAERNLGQSGRLELKEKRFWVEVGYEDA